MTIGTWSEDYLRRAFVAGATWAFVAGAAWWDYYTTHSIMWPSDRAVVEAEAEAETEAERRYPNESIASLFREVGMQLPRRFPSNPSGTKES